MVISQLLLMKMSFMHLMLQKQQKEKQRACPYPFKQMCAGGLSYYFAHHLLQIFEITDEGLERQLLTFAGIATVCDIVD